MLAMETMHLLRTGLLAVMLGGCNSFELAEVALPTEVDPRLPPMRVEFDDDSFQVGFGARVAKLSHVESDLSMGFKDDRLIVIMELKPRDPIQELESEPGCYKMRASPDKTELFYLHRPLLPGYPLEGIDSSSTVSLEWPDGSPSSEVPLWKFSENPVSSRYHDDAKAVIEQSLNKIVEHRLPDSDRSGCVVSVGLSHKYVRKSRLGFAITSACLLFVPSLFGFPFVGEDAEVRLFLSISDPGGEEIARFQGAGSTTEYVAAYWGYKESSVSRAARCIAVQRALIEIVQEIQAREGELREMILAAE